MLISEPNQSINDSCTTDSNFKATKNDCWCFARSFNSFD